MSLMDLLLAAPDAQDRFQQVSGLMGRGQGLAGVGAPPGPTGGGSGWESAAHDFFLAHGYSPQDWHKVDSIISRESGWDPHAVNDSSGAAGIAQRISGYSPDYSRNDPMEQIHWLLNYLNTHNYEGYGTGIDAAYAHKNDTGWY